MVIRFSRNRDSHHLSVGSNTVRMKTFIRIFATVVAQTFLEVLLQPENITKYKLALRQLTGDDMQQAPIKGEADEELEQKIQNSGMADVPLPPD